VEAGRNEAGRSNPDFWGEPAVEVADQGFRRNRSRNIEVSDLAGGVDSGVGATCANDYNPPASEDRRECFFDLALNRSLAALFLPTVKRPAQIGELKLHSMHHCGYPRTERRIGRWR
jgi:hypothetical protein